MSAYELGLQSAPAPDDTELDCGAFFPCVHVRPFYDDYRVPAELPEGQVLEHLRLAALRCMHSLRAVQAQAETDGYAGLTAMPGNTIDGEHEKAVYWRRAVYCEAKAEILKEAQTVERRERAENAAKTGEDTENKYREFAATALRLIAGLSRLEVALL